MLPRSAGRGSRKRPASGSLGLVSSDVHFPPAQLSDFVIHYRGTAFHVHKFVLVYHSSYFRTYIDQLTDGQRAYTKEECDEHATITHCVHLPDRCGKVDADADDCRVFLCHLYFAQHCSCIPYKVAADIDPSAQPPPAVNLNYPKFDETQLRTATGSPVNVLPAVHEAVMSLCHYFDCDRILSGAEDNCMLVVEASTADSHNWKWSEMWSYFVLSLQFDL